MANITKKFLPVGISLLLAVTTLVVFWPLHHHEFVSYDDDAYVTNNRHIQAGFTRENIVWAFTSGYASNWHPLTWLSHTLDWRLFGNHPGRHHLVNLFFHLINTLLLFWILRWTTGALWRCGFVAAVFALHPLHVESVAWLAERKDVLSGMFFLLTITVYLRYVKQFRLIWYLLTLLIFALGLMAKPMLVTLPFVLLLLDYWPLQRLFPGTIDTPKAGGKSLKSRPPRPAFARVLLEKIPFLALSIGSSIVTYIVQRRGGSVVLTDIIPLNNRVANAFASYLKYIGKMFWPARLAVLYPHPQNALPVWQVMLAGLILAIIFIAVIRLARRRGYLLVGWLWYVGMLVPVIGLVQVGQQALADRYTYLPSIGIFIIIAWSLADWADKRHYRQVALALAGSAAIAAFIVTTHMQLKYWKNNLTLFEHTVAVTKNNYIMHVNYGNALVAQDKIAEAVEQYRKSIRINPYGDKAYNNLGNICEIQNNLDEAILYYRRALNINPQNSQTQANLAKVLNLQGKREEAVTHYKKAISLMSDSSNVAEVHYSLANILKKLDKLDEAIDSYRQSLKLNPNYASAAYNLGNCLLLKDRIPEAIPYFEQALRLDPNHIGARYNLASALKSEGQIAQAIAQYRRIVQTDPNDTNTANSLAWIYATCPDPAFRDSGQAVTLALRAADLTGHKNPLFLDTLAAAYAAAGQFEQAIKITQQALELSAADNNDDFKNQLKSRLELYQQQKPYYEPADVKTIIKQ